MIYIFSVLLCFSLVIYYDVLGKSKSRATAYRWLLVWFILLSGLQYMVGTDIPVYVDEYQKLSTKFLTWDNITDYHVRYQPGWMLLCYFCKIFTNEYTLLKMIQAIFLNVAIFTFFKKHTKYIFTAVFVYAVSDYLVLNFNVMRQSFALGFGLYAITALKASDWKQYGLCTFLGYMFHNSALLLLALPLIKLFKPNKVSLAIIFLLFCIIVIGISRLDLTMLFQEILFSGYVDEGIAEVGRGYMNGDRLGVQDNFSIFSLTRLFYLIAVTYYMVKYMETFWGMFGLIYVLILILSGFLPILWRYRLYVDIPFFIMLTQVINDLSQNRRFAKNTKIFATCLMLTFVTYLSTKDLFYKGKSEPYAAIDQYYPYHSIFNPKINTDQLNYFESLSN